MKIDSTFLRSKLGRRIFWLFALCALTPIALMAGISLRNVTNQLHEQTRRELRQISHEEGMNLCERLLFLEEDLKLAETHLDAHLDREAPAKGLPANFGHRFRGLEFIGSDYSLQILFGSVSTQFQLEPSEVAHLASGKTLVTVRTCDDLEPCMFVVRQIDVQQPQKGFLAGEVLPSYLLDIDEVPQGKHVCILDSQERALRCSGERPSSFPPSTFQSVSGQFAWTHGGTDYEADYWKVFLKPTFLVEHLTIVASEPTGLITLPMAQFKRSFVLVTLLTLLVVLLLSVSQIRRNLVPLERLEEGTRRIAGGNFKSRVTVESHDEFNDVAHSFNAMAGWLEKEFDTNARLVADLKQMNLGRLTALACAIDAKSPWTLGHSERVTGMALEIGREIGLSQKHLEILNRGGLLHDIGKIGVAAQVLDKPGRLTQETRQIREHVDIGQRILEPIPGFAECMPIVVQHHEWFDGSGYPRGIAGEQISLHARIFAVADCFDALVSDRPYRAGMPLERVLEILRSGTGKQFDPRVMEAFLRLMARKSHKTGAVAPAPITVS